MDYSPFENLPLEIKELIFNYLSASDLLNLSLASKTFYETIGESCFCMSKFWIKFYSFNFKDFECLKSSSRNYEKLKVNRVNKSEHFQYLIDLKQIWRKVLVYNCEFKSFKMFLKLIESLATSVEELEISDIEILSHDAEVSKINFPALRRLMFRNMPSKSLEIFSSSSENFVNASFDIPQQVDGNVSLHEIISNILQSSIFLRQLFLGPQYVKALFSEESFSCEFAFKLENLLLKFSIVSDLQEHAFENVISFLRHQSTVKRLIIMELSNESVLKAAWNEMSSLTHISFVGLENLFGKELDVIDIEPNLSITRMDLISRNILISQLRKLLCAAPFLKFLHVKILESYMMEFIVKNHWKLRVVFYEHIEDDVVELYEQVKFDNQIEVNKNVEFIQKSFWFDDDQPFSIDPIFWRKD